MRKHVVAVGVVALSFGVAATAVAALVIAGSGRSSARHAAVAALGPNAAGSAFPASCRRRSPLRIPAESWSPARHELAPAGATSIRLCRYAGLNSRPRLALVRSVIRGAPRLVRELMREFDRLPVQGPGAIACPSDDGSQIVAVLAYPGSRVVKIAVHLTGCKQVTNGSVDRLAAGLGTPPAFGPQLVAQLERLTARVPPEPTSPQTVHPPTPQVSTLGVTRSATLVGYCWSQTLPGGGGRGVCADGAPGDPAHTLRWRPGATIRIDLRLPAHDVHIQAVRITGGFGGRPSIIVTLSVERVDRAGHIWSIRLPPRSAGDNDLLIFARFTNGDLLADLGLHRKLRHASPNR